MPKWGCYDKKSLSERHSKSDMESSSKASQYNSNNKEPRNLKHQHSYSIKSNRARNDQEVVVLAKRQKIGEEQKKQRHNINKQ